MDTPNDVDLLGIRAVEGDKIGVFDGEGVRARFRAGERGLEGLNPRRDGLPPRGRSKPPLT